MDYINELAGNDADFKAKLCSTIKRELPLEIAEYKKEIENGNYIEAANLVHKLKHKISVMGMEKSYYLAEKFENNLKNHSAQLQSDFEDVLQAMQKFADDL